MRHYETTNVQLHIKFKFRSIIILSCNIWLESTH